MHKEKSGSDNAPTELEKAAIESMAGSMIYMLGMESFQKVLDYLSSRNKFYDDLRENIARLQDSAKGEGIEGTREILKLAAVHWITFTTFISTILESASVSKEYSKTTLIKMIFRSMNIPGDTIERLDVPDDNAEQRKSPSDN